MSRADSLSERQLLLLRRIHDGDDLIIRLSDINKPDDEDWNRIRLNIRPPRRGTAARGAPG